MTGAFSTLSPLNTLRQAIDDMLSESGCLADIDIEDFNWFLIFWKSLFSNTPHQRTNYGMERTTDVWMIEKYSCWCFRYGSFIVAFKNGNEFKPAFRFDRKLEAGAGWRLLRSRNSSHNRYKSSPLSLSPAVLWHFSEMLSATKRWGTFVEKELKVGYRVRFTRNIKSLMSIPCRNTFVIQFLRQGGMGSMKTNCWPSLDFSCHCYSYFYA